MLTMIIFVATLTVARLIQRTILITTASVPIDNVARVIKKTTLTQTTSVVMWICVDMTPKTTPI